MERPQETPTPAQEESIFNDLEYSTKEYDKHIRNARITLFVIAGLQLLLMFLEEPMTDEVRWIVYGIHGSVAAVFIALAFWARYKPYPALFTATITYVVLVVLFAILDPTNIGRGILVKIIVVALLIRGIRNAKAADNIKKTFGK